MEEEQVFKIRDFLMQTGDQITETMSRLLQHKDFESIYTLLMYQTSTGGKRLRPALAVLTTQALGGKKEEILELACTFEMLHQSSIAIDDIVDRDTMRRGLPSTHALFGSGAAFMGATLLISTALKLGIGRNLEAGKLLADTLSKMAIGNTEEFIVKRYFNLKQYLRVCRYKTAALYRAPCESAAILSYSNKLEQTAARTYGENVGMLFQIADDLVDVLKTKKYDKPIGDMKEGKITLPIIHTYNTTDDEDVKEIIEDFRKQKQLSPNDWKLLFEAMDETGAIEKSKEFIEEYKQKALNALSCFPDNEYTELMRIMPDYMQTALLSEVESEF